MRVLNYSRVSSEEQKKGISITEQGDFLRDYCKKHKHTLLKEFSDPGFSGRSDRRPDFQRMIEAIESGKMRVDAILVRSTDRWFRNSRLDLEYRDRLLARNVVVIATDRPLPSDDPTPTEKWTQKVFSANDELVSDQIAWNTKKAMLAKVKANQYIGGRLALGYRVEEKGGVRSVAIDEKTAPIVRLIFQLYVAERLTAGEVVRKMASLGVKDPSGQPFTIQRIHYVLQNPSYIGKRIYNKTAGTGRKKQKESDWVFQDVPAIIDTETFETAQEIKRERRPNRSYTGTTPNAQYMLSDLCWCKHCGSKMIHRSAKGGAYEYYECSLGAKRTTAACSVTTRLPKNLLEDSVIEVLGLRLFATTRIVAIVEEVHKLSHDVESDLEELRRDLSTTEKQLQALFEELTLKDLPRDVVLPQIKRKNDRKEDLEFQIRQLEAVKEIPPEVYDLDRMIETSRKLWQWVESKKDPKRVNALFKLFIQRIEIDGDQVLIRAHLGSAYQVAVRGKGGKFLLSNKDGVPNEI